MAAEFEIIGADSLVTIFEQLPEKYGKKPIQAAFRKGAKPFIAALKKSTPVKSGDTLKSIKVLTGKGASINVGFSGKKQYMPGYMKAYWSNYGTMANRDRSHSFKQRRKAKTANRQGGIVAKRFVEDSWENTRGEVQKIINDELMNETQKFLNKHKVA